MTIRIAILNDFDVVVAGLSAMLEPFDDFEVVGLGRRYEYPQQQEVTEEDDDSSPSPSSTTPSPTEEEADQ